MKVANYVDNVWLDILKAKWWTPLSVVANVMPVVNL